MRRERAPLGAPSWIDLMTSDTDRAREFYGGLFGWECGPSDPELSGYANFTLDGVLVAGLIGKSEPALPDTWSVYIDVDDAGSAASRVRDHGGQVFMGPDQVTDLGTMVVAADVGGAAVGMWEAGTHRGFGVHNEPGAPAWFELVTASYDASLGFYRDVFGWELDSMSDTTDFRYSTLSIGGLQYAGIMDGVGHTRDGGCPAWTVYMQVESTDASTRHVEALGGSIALPAADTPYGRLVSCADPMGATFNVIQPPE